MAVEVSERWLVVSFGRVHRVASWAIIGGGLTRVRRVAWHHVVAGDLGPEVDPRELLAGRMAAAGLGDSVGLLTARRLAAYEEASVECGAIRARCIATVGLGNALRAGDRPSAHAAGTINLLCHVSVPLTECGLLEAMSIATEARTAAILELAIPSGVSGQPATGTGTDCVVIAAPLADASSARGYAGKHTPIGAAVGTAVFRAVRAGGAAWLAEDTERVRSR